MTKINLSSRICGISHTVKGRVEGDKIIIEIDTPCEKFRELSCLEIPVQRLPDNEINLVKEMEKQMNHSLECTRECAMDCTGQCLIPSAVFDVCLIEKELTEEELVKTSYMEVTEYTASEYQDY
ncbi:hypothetical protein MSHOH_3377 [Methanosarcina horonobensis HB-1 = JCM 15518]|uniref:Uncharacterized protein n=1 Tax=Methanosarcina horonobensis HB-1 = JCM 15518 TaxID=1434110 RepID=A0A0E3WU97_9EURY|nr:hypothetical protein [Methanosarcina horonobensis]AKB79860.1 hypothetical protein MSHOH_3377 [Methanosarcina horonobensis HB-1 = JCM 15518]